jgi:hypothetical protein
VRLVADDELVGLAPQAADVPGEPGVGLNGDGVPPRRLPPLLDRRDDAVAVSLLAELAVELRHEQTPMREDEDAERSRGLDEARGGDCLARSGRMAEAEAPDGTRIGSGGILDRFDLALLHVVVLDLGRLLVDRSAVLLMLRLRLVRGDQLGEHAGERIHLMAAKLGTRLEDRRPRAQDTLETEHEAVAHLPARRRR